MKKIQYITTMGLFFALALVLSALEGLLPPMPICPAALNWDFPILLPCIVCYI